LGTNFSIPVIKNTSGYDINVELKRVSDYGAPQKSIMLTPGKTLPVTPFVPASNGTQASQIARSNPQAIYQVIVRFETQLTKEPVTLDTNEISKLMTSCAKGNGNHVVIISIDLEQQRSYLGLVSTYAPVITYSCGPYPEATELQCGWFDLEERKEQDLCPLPGPSAANTIQEIIQSNPTFTESQAKDLYAKLILESTIDARLYELYKSNKNHIYFAPIRNKISQISDLVIKQIPQARALEEGAYVNIHAPGFFKQLPEIRYTINDYHKKVGTAQAPAIARELANAYKIHLMPQSGWDNTVKATQTLVNGFVADPELAQLVSAFKVRIGIPMPAPGVVMPTIVIYVFGGKEAAQKALNKIYQLFKTTKGLGITPRFNARVNDLIFVAQGDGQYKEGVFSGYYEGQKHIYYRPDFTGTITDYHLVHPETGTTLI
jgi:hypothetical protein